MSGRACPKCRAPLGPEISNPKLSDPDRKLTTVRPCPACGWNPSAPQDPPKGGKKTRKKTGPQPPKAGKKFSG